MILLFIAMVFMVGFGTVVRLFCTNEGTFMEILMGIFVGIGVIGIAICSCLIGPWVASGVQAEVLNREYSTNYTQKEIFFASNVIETIRELKRKRIEVNGNLVTGD